ncbi:P-loop containing nucleoside triphosphate hydrolase protein [Obba rivulosa]|uniref:P-loop containing nucleoside triphosphate hydrolase protein n=1 Tax=Obba rivulosa TaxID=1052685 RepID=A0A8E2DSK9_9APHY|nr:P-loop containing nucleoside triphosphate hydrolase protein [Obba rivulosa]
MTEAILQIRDLGCSRPQGDPIFEHVNFSVNEGDIVILQGKSGSGKSTLMKCLAHLNLYDGEIFYRGQTPHSYGIPIYRTRVQYVPQRTSLLPGTPRDFMRAISSFSSFKHRPSLDKQKVGNQPVLSDKPIEVAGAWGIEHELWDRGWGDLSGGEAQRIALAIAVGMQTAEVLLLDEPTSALDPDTSETVEKYLVGEVKKGETGLKAIVWITHFEEQGRRVGTRFLRITPNGVQEESQDSAV